MEDKKCLECANSMCEQTDNGFTYKCMLSKRKEHDCKDECKTDDYFKEM